MSMRKTGDLYDRLMTSRAAVSGREEPVRPILHVLQVRQGLHRVRGQQPVPEGAELDVSHHRHGLLLSRHVLHSCALVVHLPVQPCQGQ